MSLSKLLSLAGFERSLTAQEIKKDIVGSLFQGVLVLNIWMDPSKEPRAVVQFETDIDLTEIIRNQESQTAFQQLSMDFVKPARSMFVTTNADIKALKDKLFMLFQIRRLGGSKVVDAKPLTDRSCEIVFENGWDAVLKVCGKEWIIEEQKLTVCPYFDCFKK